MFSPLPAKLSRLLRTEKSGQESINLPMLVWILIKILNLSFLPHAYFVSSCLLPQCSLCFIFTEGKWPKNKSIMVYWSRVVDDREYLWLSQFQACGSPCPALSGICRAFAISFWKSCKCHTVGPGVHTKKPTVGLKLHVTNALLRDNKLYFPVNKLRIPLIYVLVTETFRQHILIKINCRIDRTIHKVLYIQYISFQISHRVFLGLSAPTIRAQRKCLLP